MIACENLTLRLGDFSLDDLSFEVGEGECLCLMGPSGAGKTVLLETIAGLHRPDRGRVLIRGMDATDMSPEARAIGLVYQDASLFPHLTVAENVGFGLEIRRTPARELRDRMETLLERFSIRHLAHRYPSTLSGGEQQRVALARALAVKPDILLLDEPFAAVDRESRNRLLDDLDSIRHEEGLTMIQVTHALEDALAIANRLAVIIGGRIQHIGPAASVLASPANERVARFIGIENLISGVVRSNTREGCDIEFDRSGLLCRSRQNHLPVGQRVTACIRAADVRVGPIGMERKPCGNVFRGTIVERRSAGGVARIALDCTGTLVYALVLERTPIDPGFARDSETIVSVEPGAVHLIPVTVQDTG